jgi:hypothetical protein
VYCGKLYLYREMHCGKLYLYREMHCGKLFRKKIFLNSSGDFAVIIKEEIN